MLSRMDKGLCMKFPNRSALLLLSFTLCHFYDCISIPLPSQPLAVPQEKIVVGTIPGGKDKILVISIEGEIFEHSSPGNLLGGSKESLVGRVKTQLTMAQRDENIKAVILKIDSPGGSVTASDIIHHEIKEFKKKRDIPVVSLFMDMAASGGYYIAMATDYIMAHPTTTTGSIGVILFNVNAKEALDKLGIRSTTIRSGPNKATGNPFEEFTPEQRKVYEDIITETYERFLTIVKEGRPKLKENEIRTLADGRIYSAKQAQQKGLVDSIGYFENIVTVTKGLPGYKASSPGAVPKIIFYSYKESVPENFYQIQNNGQASQGVLEELIPGKQWRDFRMYYLYTP